MFTIIAKQMSTICLYPEQIPEPDNTGEKVNAGIQQKILKKQNKTSTT